MAAYVNTKVNKIAIRRINRHFFKFCCALLSRVSDNKQRVISSTIANCRNVRALGRVSYLGYTENLNISTEMSLNEKLPSQV